MRVDFYITAGEAQDRWSVVCRLVEKAWSHGHRVFVYCNHKQEAETLDELLWTFRDDSFIPHNLQGEGPEPPPPVQIGYGAEPRGFSDILLNLANEVPPFYQRFNRVMEVIGKEEAAKETGRAHFRLYRNNQCELHTHTIE